MKNYNNEARSFVTIMIIVALSALLLRTAIEKLIVYNVGQNQLLAKGNLKLLSTALENYAKDNMGAYPVNIELLTNNIPPYLEKNYLAVSMVRGYEYDCEHLDSTGYNCSATPVNCQLTGELTYVVSTGGLIIAERCDKK
jgi:hypothetical protein